jgi:hypothetical protein
MELGLGSNPPSARDQGCAAPRSGACSVSLTAARAVIFEKTGCPTTARASILIPEMWSLQFRRPPRMPVGGRSGGGLLRHRR